VLRELELIAQQLDPFRQDDPGGAVFPVGFDGDDLDHDGCGGIMLESGAGPPGMEAAGDDGNAVDIGLVLEDLSEVLHFAVGIGKRAR